MEHKWVKVSLNPYGHMVSTQQVFAMAIIGGIGLHRFRGTSEGLQIGFFSSRFAFPIVLLSPELLYFIV